MMNGTFDDGLPSASRTRPNGSDSSRVNVFLSAGARFAVAAAPRRNPRRLSPVMPYFSSCATAASAALKPTLLCVPSQKGFVTEPPQRHSAMRGPRALVSIVEPLTSISSKSPSTRYGPLGRIVILVGIRTVLLGVGIADNDSTAPGVDLAR